MIYKKIVGTMTLLIFILGASLATYSFVSAHYNPQKNLNYEGVVASKSSSSIMLLTSEKNPVKIYIDKKTNFVGKLTFADIGEGDHLKIDAERQDSRIVAKTVKEISSGHGYGREGKHFSMMDVRIISKDFDHKKFTIDDGGRHIDIRVDSSTEFIDSDFKNIQIGSRIHIDGDEDGEGHYARNVIRER